MSMIRRDFSKVWKISVHRFQSHLKVLKICRSVKSLFNPHWIKIHLDFVAFQWLFENCWFHSDDVNKTTSSEETNSVLPRANQLCITIHNLPDWASEVSYATNIQGEIQIA